MIIAKIIALIGAIAQGGILIYGFTQGDFPAAGKFFFNEPWGIVALVDVYVGFLFFIGWVFYREDKIWKTIAWSISILILGNFPAGVYALFALQKSSNDWRKFWMGKNYILKKEKA